MKKTSLMIDDLVFREAQKEAVASGRTLSDVISDWARRGFKEWVTSKRRKRTDFKPLQLGEVKIDYSTRKNWMEDLDDDRD